MILVTGTGRCGTASAAQLLRDAGLDVTHQGIRHEHVHRRQLSESFGNSGDVSFEAAPMAGLLRSAGWKIVLIHRDPAAVVQSWLSLGAFGDWMEDDFVDWTKSLRRWAPNVLENPLPIARATRFYIDWNRLVLPYAHHVVDVGRFKDRNPLLEACELPAGPVRPWPWVDDGTPTRTKLELDSRIKLNIQVEVAEALGEQFGC